MFRAINPTTGELIAELPFDPAHEVEARLQAADEAAARWRTTPMTKRAEHLRRAGELLRDRRSRYARLMVDEMGKTIAQARAEVDKCAWACDHFAEVAAETLAPTPVDTDASDSLVRRDPLGPVLAIMPWNFPFWQVFRFAAPALMAGNVGLLKHAPNVPGCALAIEEIFADAGFPSGVFQNLLVGVDTVAELIADRRVRAVTLTGSVGAGRAVGAQAGRHLKPSVLELGGSDAFIVLDDCDLDLAVEGAVVARTLNNGQSCIAAKRFLVQAGIHDDFVARFQEALAALKVGDPSEEESDLGPLARPDLRDQLHDQTRRAIAAGARCVLGGELPEGPGNFYPPTLLLDVTPGMAVFDEEVFGPVAALTRFETVDEAVALANGSDYGLGASVWSADSQAARALAARLEVGHVSVNGIVKSDPRLPFGGVKDSGYGRELGSFGLHAFVNVKSVWVR